VTAEGNRSVALGSGARDNLIFTGDITIQYITEPIRRLSFDYATSIENFLRLYLGRPGERRGEPFAARAFVAEIGDRFPRHRAFQDELKRASQGDGAGLRVRRVKLWAALPWSAPGASAANPAAA